MEKFKAIQVEIIRIFQIDILNFTSNLVSFKNFELMFRLETF